MPDRLSFFFFLPFTAHFWVVKMFYDAGLFHWVVRSGVNDNTDKTRRGRRA